MRAGVAICANRDAWSGKPRVIQQWPGLKTDTTPINANKVPTKVGYKAGEKGIDSWGFECPSLENISRGMAIKDMFKFYLDGNFLGEKFQRNPEEIPKFEDVKSWYTDFLAALYAHIIQFLWERLRVDVKLTPIEFIFSIPTSWKDKDLMVRCFRDLVDIAGFGRAGNVIMELTEGEASAVFTAKHLWHEFQVLSGNIADLLQKKTDLVTVGGRSLHCLRCWRRNDCASIRTFFPGVNQELMRVGYVHSTSQKCTRRTGRARKPR